MRQIPRLIFNNEIVARRADMRKVAQSTPVSKNKDALNIIFFDGMPLVNKTNSQTRITYLSHDHWLLTHVDLTVFLGLYKGKSIFAHNILKDQKDSNHKDTLEYFNKNIQKDIMLNMSYFVNLRNALTDISEEESALAGTGRALIHWNLNSKYCGKCGLALSIKNCGWERHCNRCNQNHFPRIDPVVIVLIISGNKTLIGRSPHFPEKLYSCLAGFVEPGETIEMAAKREVQEEVGLKIYDIEYVANQPWPFPSSLMIGLKGNTNQTLLDIDKNELEDAVWLTKEELKNLLKGNCSNMQPARQGTLARHLLDSWVRDKI